MTLYCDMDGVLVDFGAGALALVNRALEDPIAYEGCEEFATLQARLYERGRGYVVLEDLEKAAYRGLQEDEVIPEARWLMKQLIFAQGAEWWENLPWTPNGKALWEGLKEREPTILTAPMAGATGCEAGKLKWVEKNLGDHIPVILEDEKFHYATTAGESNVLVDDFVFNTIPWEEHGGTPVLHVDGKIKYTLVRVAELLG
jgi:hypothetical protein